MYAIRLRQDQFSVSWYRALLSWRTILDISCHRLPHPTDPSLSYPKSNSCMHPAPYTLTASPSHHPANPLLPFHPLPWHSPFPFILQLGLASHSTPYSLPFHPTPYHSFSAFNFHPVCPFHLYATISSLAFNKYIPIPPIYFTLTFLPTPYKTHPFHLNEHLLYSKDEQKLVLINKSTFHLIYL